MKKFFGILLAAVSALVLLPGCGGGGDTDPTKMTAREFARGSKYFIFQNGLAGWLYVTPDKQFSGYTITGTNEDGVASETVPAVVGKINVGGPGGGVAGYEYICNYDAEGLPQTAELTVSTESPSQGNQALITFFNEAQGDDGEQVQDLRGAPVIHIDFRTNRFTIKAQVEMEDGDAEVVEFGGMVVVQHQ